MTAEENTIQEQVRRSNSRCRDSCSPQRVAQGGIARQFNTEMFDSLQRTTNCNLENVVYYRG